jgi:hypothetical protein
MHSRADAEVTSFTEKHTRRILNLACHSVGIDPGQPKLLRHTSNGVYLIERAGVVAKVARPEDNVSDIQRTVALTRWLASNDFPTVPLYEVDQPVVIEGNAVTFWRYLPQDQPISAVDIAEPLRELHLLPQPPANVVPALPALAAISAIRSSLGRERILSAAEHDFLISRCAALETALSELRYENAPCVLHGDPQHGNALWNSGHAVLSDWESVVIGPAEWDLVTIEIHCRRFQHPLETYLEFCRIYGRDVRRWDGYAVMRDIRELRMVATNARKSAPTSPGAAEVRRRITQLLEEDNEGSWSIL